MLKIEKSFWVSWRVRVLLVNKFFGIILVPKIAALLRGEWRVIGIFRSWHFLISELSVASDAYARRSLSSLSAM